VAFSISVDLPTLTDETAWYRAEYWGFAVGHEASPVFDPHDGGLYVYAISDLQAARAYAAIREHQDGIKRSVYRVNLIGEPLPDPDYAVFSEFVRCASATLEEVIEPRPTMSPDEATKYICQTDSPPWPGSDIPMYDSEGYPTASRATREAGIDASLLRHLGRYKPPQVIGCHAERLVTST
jgi:hypothetical protein